LKKRYKGREDEEEDVRNYWMALWKQEDTEYCKRSPTVENSLWTRRKAKQLTGSCIIAGF
jgi:hypothetical protein